jgi:hypothetical protein
MAYDLLSRLVIWAYGEVEISSLHVTLIVFWHYDDHTIGIALFKLMLS